jgi:hypothetical protein
MNQKTKLRKLLEEERRLSAQIHARRIFDFAKARARQGREQGDPLAGTRALVAAQRALYMLATQGYPLLRPLLFEVQFAVAEIRRLLLSELVRRLMLDEVPEPQATEACAMLQGLAEEGFWPTCQDDVEDVEAQLNEADAALQQRA